MIKSRKVIIESAVMKVFGDQIKLNFSSKKISVSNSQNIKKVEINNLSENEAKKSNDFNKSNQTPENPKKSSFEDSSQNLASFFNGDIVDLDE